MSVLAGMKHLYLLFALLVTGSTLLATDYYVAKDGSDDNDGSEAAPFLTLGKASAVMMPGDVCYVKEGTYREVLQSSRAGTAAAPITFRNFSTDEVWIRATEEVTGWDVHEGDVWRADIRLTANERNAVYYNGELLDLARWPNNTDNDKFTIDAMPITGGTASTIVASELTDASLGGGYVWYLGAHSGTSWTRRLTGRSGNTLSFNAVDINRWPFNPHNPTVFRNNNRGRFFVFGSLGLLDHPREWFYGGGVLYLQAPDNADPNAATVEVAEREHTVWITHDYVTIEGLNTFGGKVRTQGNNTIIRNCIISHGLETLDELDNTDAQVGNGSVHIQSSNNLIENNLIEYGSLNGVWIQGWGGVANNTIKQNEVRYFNTVGNHSSPIRAVASGTKVLNNTVYGAGRDGIFLPAEDCEFAFNDFSEVMLINNDGGLFYVVGNDNNKNTSIHHNWFHDSAGPEYADGRTAGIYLDNDSKGYDVYRNVVWNITWSAVQMNWAAWNNDIFNNSFYEVEGAMGIWLNGRTQRDNRIFNNYSSLGPWHGQEIADNIIDATNPFTDLEERNFVPRGGSPLIDAGREIEGVTDGFVGSAPDVGAYEAGEDPWIPGATRAGVMTNVFAPRVRQLAVSTFPNPTAGATAFNVDLPRPTGLDWKLLTIDGRQVAQGAAETLPAGAHRFELPTDQLPAGVYVLHGRTERAFFTDRVVVE